MGMCSGASDIYIIVGLSALLVSTKRGSSRALTREASDRELAPRFFCICTFYYLTIRSPWQPSDILFFMRMEKNDNYEAPVVEIIEVEVEKGFATSSGGENGYPRPF